MTGGYIFLLSSRLYWSSGMQAELGIWILASMASVGLSPPTWEWELFLSLVLFYYKPWQMWEARYILSICLAHSTDLLKYTNFAQNPYRDPLESLFFENFTSNRLKFSLVQGGLAPKTEFILCFLGLQLPCGRAASWSSSLRCFQVQVPIGFTHSASSRLISPNLLIVLSLYSL